MDEICSFLGGNADHISDGASAAKGIFALGKFCYNAHQASKAFGGDSGFRKETPEERSHFIGKRVDGDSILWHHDVKLDGSWLGMQQEHQRTFEASPGFVINCIVLKDLWKDGTNGSVSIPPYLSWTANKCRKVEYKIRGEPFRGIHWDVWIWQVPVSTMKALMSSK